MEIHNNGRRQVPYATSSKGQEEVFNWLRQNPHRLHLGRIGLDISLQDGRKAQRKDIEQRLNLWEGLLESSFSLDGQEVKTITCCHPERDLLAFWIKSDLLAAGKIKIAIDFPYGSPNKNTADWTRDEKHSTEVVKWNKNSLELMRILDEDRYFLQISFSENGRVIRKGRNSFVIENTGEEGEIEFTCSFTPIPGRGKLPSFYETAASSKKYWESFWMKGGAVELSESSDPRALELERRIVLYQYLTAIQCGGSLPPQETGLTCNSWYGKFHLEMHWWHCAHFPFWGRVDIFEKSMWWYKRILYRAKEKAKTQGYHGARWPKMTDMFWEEPSFRHRKTIGLKKL